MAVSLGTPMAKAPPLLRGAASPAGRAGNAGLRQSPPRGYNTAPFPLSAVAAPAALSHITAGCGHATATSSCPIITATAAPRCLLGFFKQLAWECWAKTPSIDRKSVV